MKCDENLGRIRSARLDIRAAALNTFHGVVKWKGRDDDDIRVCRVTLFTERVMPENADAWFANMRAKVSFGVGAIKSDVFVDWKNGTQLSLAAHYIDVSVAVINRLIDGSADDNDSLQQFGAMINHGGDARRDLNTLTEPAATIPAAGFLEIPIPPFAYAVLFHAIDQASFFVALTFIAQSGSGDGAGALLSSIDGLTFTTSGARIQGWPLHSAARRVRIQNGGAGPIDVSPQFLIGV